VVKLALLLAFVLIIPANSADKKVKYECRRWGWTGDVYNRKVFCLEWRRKDPQ
jgi:hypothetical protein